MLLAITIGSMGQGNSPTISRPTVKGGTTTPSIPIVIRGGSHPSSQGGEGEARFVRTAVLDPTLPDDTIRLPFSLGIVATALDTDRSTLCRSFAQWTEVSTTVPVMYEDEMILCLTDYGSIRYTGGRRGSYWLTADGTVADTPDADLLYTFSVDTITQYLTLDISQRPGALHEGDVCFAQFAFNLKGRIVTFEVTVTISAETRGPSIPLAGMEKVGEQVVTATFDLTDEASWNLLNIDFGAINTMFGTSSPTSSMLMYVMTDYGQQLLTDYYTYHTPMVTLDIEGLETSDYGTGLWYILSYDPLQQQMSVQFDSRAFAGGECGSGSIFLAKDGQYCELVLDLHFGNVADNRTDFNIVGTNQLNVQLLPTSTYYTSVSHHADSTIYSLVSTPLDMLHISELIGTETPMLYAEQHTAGATTLTRNYTARPGQGFWFSTEGGTTSVSPLTPNCLAGVYYNEGELKWYEVPDVPRVGDTGIINLYLANPKKGIAVKYEIRVEYVAQLTEPTTHAIRRLPIGMNAADGTTTAIRQITHSTPESSAINPEYNIFNLQGQQLNAPVRGMNIVNGEKILIK